MKESVNLHDEVKRVVSVVESNNLGLLNLVLHLLYRASISPEGKVALTKQDLKTFDKYLLKPEEVFPTLNKFF